MGVHKLRNKKEEESSAYKLFNTRFPILIQNKAFYTAFELEEIGFISCGSVANNELYLNEYRLVKTTLDKIAEWNARGDSIRFTDLKDATTMYRIMDQHMQNWLEVTKRNPGIKIPPIDDFEALDLLCSMLHPLVDVDVHGIDDPGLLMLFGNALTLGSLGIINPDGDTITEPYVPYSPQLYVYTKFRWEV